MKHPSGFTLSVANDLAAVGINSQLFGIQHSQRYGIGPAGMAVYAFQPDRALGKGLIQISTGGKFGLGGVLHPVVLIPAAPQQPGVVRQLYGMLLQPVDDFIDAAGADQIGIEQGKAQIHDMTVSIDQAGNDQPDMIQIKLSGIRILRQHIVVAAHSKNLASRRKCHGLGAWLAAIHGFDAGIDNGCDCLLSAFIVASRRILCCALLGGRLGLLASAQSAEQNSGDEEQAKAKFHVLFRCMPRQLRQLAVA